MTMESTSMTPEQYDEMVKRVEAVESSQRRIEQNTKDLLEAFNAVRGAFTTVEWAGKISKNIIPLFIAAGAAAYGTKMAWDAMVHWIKG